VIFLGEGSHRWRQRRVPYEARMLFWAARATWETQRGNSLLWAPQERGAQEAWARHATLDAAASRSAIVERSGVCRALATCLQSCNRGANNSRTTDAVSNKRHQRIASGGVRGMT